MKKILFTLALLSVFGGTETQVWAWDGSGTQADPYLIRNSEAMDTLATETNAGNVAPNTYFKLTGDVTLRKCVGTADHPFQGHFDGGGNTINASLAA